MKTHLIVIADKSAPSFCFYQHNCRQKELMPLAILRNTIAYATREGLALILLCGKEPLPAEYEAALASVDHIKIAPVALAEKYPDAVLISDGKDAEALSAGGTGQIIVQLTSDRLCEMAAVIRSFSGKCSKINFYLSDVDKVTDIKIDEYEKQLVAVADFVEREYRQGNFMELNIISDRMLLRQMNNCNAGVIHYTVAPNGNFYLCPGFFYTDEQNSVGDITHGLQMKNGQLLELENAPICSRCDAYHCKRCVYLNNRLTLEWNTPSRQQCVTAHLERNAARRVQQALKLMPPFSLQAEIPEISYLDPFSLVTRKVQGR
ncbi:MAG: CXXX repeat peptide maturase [Negativicutes bacterium]|nr:CXXX repeat peptide maturase [Negativicutes bacterium]